MSAQADLLDEAQVTWPAVALADVAQVVNGGTPKSKVQEYWGGNVQWLTPKEMGGMTDRRISATERTITETGLAKSSARLVPPNSLILSTRASIGHLAINEIEMAFNQGCRGIVPSADLDVGFLYYFLLANRQTLNDLGTGTTFKELSATNLKSFRLPLPPLDKQKRIVAVLDQAFAALDRARELIEANISDTQLLENRVRETELDSSGKSWVKTTIGDICDHFEYGTSAKSAREGAVPVLRMGNLQNGEIDWDDLKYSDDSSDIAKYSLNDGDVLFNRTNSIEHVGKTAIYRGEREAIFAGYLIRLHYRRHQLHPDYLNIFLNSDRARAYGHSLMGKSVNQANISASKLKTYPIALPSLAEQWTIAEKIGSIKELTGKFHGEAKVKLANIDDLKQSILSRAFAGELT